MPDHVVRQGECISSIAHLYGLSWKGLWDAAENRDLQTTRQDPNVLFPGDVVKIPVRRAKEIVCATGAVHRFQVVDYKAMLRIRLLNGDRPRANETYRLEIDGAALTGRTDAAGWLEKKIPPNAVRGKLTLSNGLEKYELKLGDLDPVNEISGMESRLMNLGYYSGPVSGSMNSGLQTAIRAFQAAKDIPQSGEADEATKAALRREHAS